MVPSFCNAHVSVPYYAMLQMPKTFHMGNIKCILQDKIQNKLLYLTAARVNSLNTWRAFVICYSWFNISSIWNKKKREYYCVHGQAGRIKQSLVHVEFTVECFNIWTHIGLLRNTFKPKIAYSFMGDNWHW